MPAVQNLWLSPLLLEDFLNLVQFFLSDLTVFDEMYEERFRGTVENTLYEIMNHAADDFALGLRRTIDISSIAQRLREATLLFENSHHRHDCGVRNLPVL